MSKTDNNNPADAKEKLRIALEMFGLGESIMRQKLRRTHPQASELEIEQMVASWLFERPGADYADSSGRLRPDFE